MQNFCYPINFPFVDEIKKFSWQFLKDNNYKSGGFLQNFPENLLQKINTQLIKLGLSEIRTPLYFIKNKDFTDEFREIHVDGNALINRITKTSIIIPLAGCENTKQIWYTGDYTQISKIVDGVGFWSLVWNQSPKFLHSYCIKDVPHAAKVDIPHTAIANGIDQRITCTLRFRINYDLEEVVKVLE